MIPTQTITCSSGVRNHTAFGRAVRQAARRIMDLHLSVHDFGFQDGGCAIFARSLVIWSEGRLHLGAYVLEPARVQHVVAHDGIHVMDSDGMATIPEGSAKMERLEQCPGCIFQEAFEPSPASSIPWDEKHSAVLAEALSRLLPPAAAAPWRIRS